jgi:zinc transport system ATP-binding protein
MTVEPIVIMEGVNFSYDGSPVLEDVSLEICPNEALYVVGPNGGGKTTLLRMILGLLQPDSGVVRVFGVSPRRARLRLGYMPQLLHFDPHFPVTALDVVLMGRLGRSLTGRYGRADVTAAARAMEELKVYELRNRQFSRLSGGQRQRVLIARALCDDPDLLLLDEATSNVDVRAGERLYEILTELSRKMAILMVSHDIGFVHNIFKRVVLVNRQVVAVRTCEMSGELVQEIYGEDHRIIHYHG